ncbi:MAG TPA: tetratricopeptide repeat protein [Terriglobales bacterium]|nr:tetratricopeptide repeat protein [Terriglobales bacterium]
MRVFLSFFRRSPFCVLFIVTSAFWLPAASQTAGLSFDELVSGANSAREQNDPARAIELYTRALQVNPKWPDGWWFVGSLEYRTGAYAEAQDALSHYIELTSDPGPALGLRGLCKFEIGDYTGAVADIEKGISLGAANDPRNEQILRYDEALALTRLGRFQDALKSYSYLAQNKITSPELIIAIGLAGLRMSLLPKDMPDDQQPLVEAAGSATFQFMSGDEPGARKTFEELFRRFPDARNAHYLYGYLLFNTDADSALAEFRRELEVQPTNTEAAVMGARILLLRNRAAEALPFAQKAVAQEPNSAAAELVLGQALSDGGDVHGSIEHLEHALKLEPDNLEVHIALAKSYSRSGRKDDARRERLLCLQLTNPDAATSPSP